MNANLLNGQLININNEVYLYFLIVMCNFIKNNIIKNKFFFILNIYIYPNKV